MFDMRNACLPNDAFFAERKHLLQRCTMEREAAAAANDNAALEVDAMDAFGQVWGYIYSYT